MGRRRPSEPLPSEPRSSLHSRFPDAELDLHGMTRRQALTRVDHLLDTWSRRGGDVVLRIVTGRGNRSAVEPVLVQVVGDRLREELGRRVAEMGRDPGGGAWLVRLLAE